MWKLFAVPHLSSIHILKSTTWTHQHNTEKRQPERKTKGYTCNNRPIPLPAEKSNADYRNN